MLILSVYLHCPAETSQHDVRSRLRLFYRLCDLPFGMRYYSGCVQWNEYQFLKFQGETRSKRQDWTESPRLPLSNFGHPMDAGPIGRGLYATELVSVPSHWKFSGAVEIFGALHECEIFKSAMLSYLYSLHLVPLQLSTFNHLFNLAGHVPCCNEFGTFDMHWNILQLLSSSDPHKLIFYSIWRIFWHYIWHSI